MSADPDDAERADLEAAAAEMGEAIAAACAIPGAVIGALLDMVRGPDTRADYAPLEEP